MLLSKTGSAKIPYLLGQIGLVGNVKFGTLRFEALHAHLILTY